MPTALPPAARRATDQTGEPAADPSVRRRSERPLRRPARPDEILDAACRAIVERGFAQTRQELGLDPAVLDRAMTRARDGGRAITRALDGAQPTAEASR